MNPTPDTPATSRKTRRDGRVDQRTRRHSFQDVASAVGASRTHVSRVLRGKSGVSADLAKKIAAVLGVGTSELLRHIEQCRDRREWEARVEYNRAYAKARRQGHPAPSEVAKRAAAGVEVAQQS